MKERLQAMLNAARGAVNEVETEKSLQDVRVQYLGKKGEMTSIMKSMGALLPEERPIVGALANQVKEELEQLIEARLVEIRQIEIARRLKEETIDVTLPGRGRFIGSKHPITLVTEEIGRGACGGPGIGNDRKDGARRGGARHGSTCAYPRLRRRPRRRTRFR
jgi:phenylalanyl-tRNA synthetase alpha chain